MKKKMMIITSTLKLGGAERAAVNTAKLFGNIYDVTMAVFDCSDMAYQTTCDIIDLSLPSVSGKIGKVINALRRSRKLRVLKKKYGTDYAMSFGPGANLANLISAGQEFCFPTMHSYGSALLNFHEKILYRRASAIGCVSKVISEKISAQNPALACKIHTIYNPYDVATITEQGKAEIGDYIFNDHTVIAHGRLDEVKNYPRLIKAIFLARERIHDAQLLIIGEGPQRPLLEKLIDKYMMADCVSLLGFRSNPFSYLEKASLYVLSSFTEGFPNALIEGMVFLPAIAVDCKSGPREILSDGPIDQICSGRQDVDFGVLVQPAESRVFSEAITEDDRILSETIISVFENREQMCIMRENARKRAEIFSCAAYRDRLQKIFELGQKNES